MVFQNTNKSTVYDHMHIRTEQINIDNFFSKNLIVSCSLITDVTTVTEAIALTADVEVMCNYEVEATGFSLGEKDTLLVS